MLNDPSQPDKYKDNLIKLEIYFEELNYEKVQEKAAYSVSQAIYTFTPVLSFFTCLIKPRLLYAPVALILCLQPQNYLSDLGGVCGLWLGMSILTFFEFVEFVMDAIVLFCVDLFRKKKPSPPVHSSQSRKEVEGRVTLDSPVPSKRVPYFQGRVTLSFPRKCAGGPEIETSKFPLGPGNPAMNPMPDSEYYSKKIFPAPRVSSSNSIMTSATRQGALTAGSTERDPEDLEIVMSPPSYSSCTRERYRYKSKVPRHSKGWDT